MMELMAIPNGTVKIGIVPSTSQVNVGESFEVVIHLKLP
jgi:hypothetical protein